MKKKNTKKKTNNLLEDIIFYLENRTVKWEELEVTEEIKSYMLWYRCCGRENVNRTTNIRPLKRDLKCVV